MKISQIELFQVDLPYSGGVYMLSGGRSYTSFDASIVRITCDDGTRGWGESAPFGSTYIAAHALGTRSGIAEIAPHLLGRDPRQLDRINDAMDDALVGQTTPRPPSTWRAGTSSESPSDFRSVNCSAARPAFPCR
jgi:L-alanine-DL-glutamate epimerase-like enolase superfamily enzyme